MNTKRNSKIFAALLSMLLLLAACLCFGVTAEEAEPSVEILYNNLEYGENISILYAAKVNGAGESPNLKLNIYTKKEQDDGSYAYSLDIVVTDYEIQEVTVNGSKDNYYVFKFPGIPPKHLNEIIIAELVLDHNGTKYVSNASRFSVTEYCFKRLYKDTNSTEKQIKLYKDIISYGSSVQNVLNYKTDDTPSNVYYVNVENVNVDTVNVNGESYNFSAGIFKAGDKFTLKYPGELNANQKAIWTVTYTDNSGNVTSQDLPDNTTVTVSDKHIVSISYTIYLVDFENYNYDNAIYDNNILTNPANGITLSSGKNTVADGAYTYVKGEIKADPFNAANNALYLYGKWNGGATTAIAEFDLFNDATEGNKYTFSAKMDIHSTAQTSGDIFRFFFKNASGTNGYVSYAGSPKSQPGDNNVGITTSVLFTSHTANTGTAAIPFNTGYAPRGEWIDFKIELYYHADGYVKNGYTTYYTAKYYVNDYFVGDDFNFANNAGDITNLVIQLNQQNTELFLDDISFIRGNGIFTEGEPDYCKKMAAPEQGANANGTGLYYSNPEKTGDRLDFDTVNKDNTDAGPAMANSYITEANAYLAQNGKYAFFEKTGTISLSNHPRVYYTPFDTYTNNAPENSYEVYELDFAMSSDKASAVVLSVNGNGVKNSIFFNAAENGTITLANSVKDSTTLADGYSYNSELENASLVSNRWYNLRFEIYKDVISYTDNSGNPAKTALIKVFVDGVEYQSLRGVDNGTDNSNQLGFQLRAADTDSWICFDNIYIGYETLPEAAE